MVELLTASSSHTSFIISVGRYQERGASTVEGVALQVGANVINASNTSALKHNKINALPRTICCT
jgi:hypothetical protein